VDSLFNVNPTVPSPITTPRDQGISALSSKHHVSSISAHTHTNKPRAKLTNQAHRLVKLANPCLAEDLPGESTEFTSRTKEKTGTCSIYESAYNAHSIDALLAPSTYALGRTENTDARLYLDT